MISAVAGVSLPRYTRSSLNSFLQKRTPIPGGLSHATVLFSSFILNFSKARLYSLQYRD